VKLLGCPFSAPRDVRPAVREKDDDNWNSVVMATLQLNHVQRCVQSCRRVCTSTSRRHVRHPHYLPSYQPSTSHLSSVLHAAPDLQMRYKHAAALGWKVSAIIVVTETCFYHAQLLPKHVKCSNTIDKLAHFRRRDSKGTPFVKHSDRKCAIRLLTRGLNLAFVNPV